jgi:hypothetical protein
MAMEKRREYHDNTTGKEKERRGMESYNIHSVAIARYSSICMLLSSTPIAPLL